MNSCTKDLSTSCTNKVIHGFYKYMGCEGGSLPSRRELVRTTVHTKSNVNDPEVLQARFQHCYLSTAPLQPPLVALISPCRSRAALANKDVLLQTIIASRLKEMRKSGKYWCDVNVDSVPVTCSVTGKQFNGIISFHLITPCGCVISEGGLKELNVIANSPCICGIIVAEVIKVTQEL